ncbi:hypothetical protein D9M68_957070 [compost metagenome]
MQQVIGEHRAQGMGDHHHAVIFGVVMQRLEQGKAAVAHALPALHGLGLGREIAGRVAEIG